MKLIILAPLCFLLTVPCRAQDSDPFADDARLLQKRTIKAAGIPVKELLEDLTKQTGIQLTAGPRVAEEKVVLFAHDRPLVDSLRIIAKFFNFYWGRTGQPGSYAYTLSQSLRQQQAEQAEIEAEYGRAADQILKELRLIQEYRKLSPEETIEMRRQLNMQRIEVQDTARLGDLMDRNIILSDLERPGGALLGTDFVSKYDRNGIIALLKSSESVIAWPPTPGVNPMEPALRDQILQLVKEQNARNNVQVDEMNFVKLTVRGGHDAKPSLNGEATAGFRMEGSTRQSGFGFRFPINQFHYLFASEAPAGPPDWKAIPALNVFVSGELHRVSAGLFRERKPLEPTFLARVFTTLNELQPLDVIADAFYSTRPANVTIKGKLLGEALTQIAQTTAHRWSYADGFIVFRDCHYSAHRPNEPRLTSLRRWASLPTDEFHTLDVLSEVAAQAYLPYSTTFEVLTEIGLTRDSLLGGSRGHLTFWNALTPIQRAAALSTQGLPYAAMGRDLRRLFELASLSKLAAEGLRSSDQERAWPPSEIDKAVFAVEKHETVMWGFRTSSGYSAGGGTREQALGRAKKDNPNATIDQIHKAMSVRYTFHYRSPGFRTTGHLSMPLRWSNPVAEEAAQP